MSRYCAEIDAQPILAAAEKWKQDCLLEGQSIFGTAQLWTVEHNAELEKYFINNLDEGEGDFFSKLEAQLQPALDQTKQLAAEMLWVMLLCPSNIGPEKKRESVAKIWSWSKSTLDTHHPLMADAVLAGIGSSGTSYNTNRWRELVFFIQVLKAFLLLSSAQRATLLTSAEAFAKWIAEVPDAENRQLRHMLLFLLFPDDFERIFGGIDRKAIVKAFLGLSNREVHKLSAYEIDQKLAEIRQKQIDEFVTDELDFYVPPLRNLWKDAPSKSYLFSWNPDKWEWKSFAEDLAKTSGGETVILRWRCANGQVKVGDKAYLFRTGSEPRGIIAAGNVMTEPYQAEHYDAAKAAEGKVATYVDIEFTKIVDPAVDPYLPLTELNKIAMDNQEWNPQSSGIEIKKRSAGALEKRWQQVKIQEKTQKPIKKTDIAKPINLILYGPPGTGKTYTLNTQYLKKYQQPVNTVSAEEWLENQIKDLSWWEVVFVALYELGGETKAKDIVHHPYVLAKAKLLGRKKHIANQVWSSLQTHTRENSATVQYAKRSAPFVFDKSEQGLWSLVDDWREDGSYLIECVDKIKLGAGGHNNDSINRYEFVTFHQAYSYEDFVEGIRPQETEAESGDIIYKVEPGVFRRIADLAKLDPEHRYAIFIDEINRGNIAKILGELITLIEIDKRAVYSKDGTLLSGMELTLPYSRDKFGVPKNLDIIATMNTADRSIALLDTALRRRFTFKELMPTVGLISGAQSDGYIPDGEGGLINLRALLSTLNKRIRFLLHRDQTIGHAYFTSVRDFYALKQVFLNQLIPLLQEYFYEDWHRIQLVFRDVGPNNEKIEPQIICHEEISEVDILGFDHDDYDDSIEYWVVDENEMTPDSIRKIYESD